jgi:hypothetical protein
LFKSQKYYDENNNLSSCLNGQKGDLPNTCILRLDVFETINSTIDISENDTYNIFGHSPSSHVIFSIDGEFTFKISKNYVIMDLNV